MLSSLGCNPKHRCSDITRQTRLYTNAQLSALTSVYDCGYIEEKTGDKCPEAPERPSVSVSEAVVPLFVQ